MLYNSRKKKYEKIFFNISVSNSRNSRSCKIKQASKRRFRWERTKALSDLWGESF
jgi:hypothetical protein